MSPKKIYRWLTSTWKDTQHHSLPKKCESKPQWGTPSHASQNQISSVQFSHSVMSDSLQPHRWQATRLPHRWDSPGKNTGVACHFLLQCMKVKSESEVAQSCLTLSNPMDCSLPGSSVHRSFQVRVLEWVTIAFSGWSEWLLSKSLQTINAGEGVEEREPSYTVVGGNEN